jgi:hypothetical protein
LWETSGVFLECLANICVPALRYRPLGSQSICYHPHTKARTEGRKRHLGASLALVNHTFAQI